MPMTPEQRRRQRTGAAVLNEYQVALIKRNLLAGMSARELAMANGVGLETIRRIDRGDTWDWIEPLPANGKLRDTKTELELAQDAARGLEELITSGLAGPVDKLLVEVNQELDKAKQVDGLLEKVKKL